jgi:hypothetical protein
VPVLPILCAPEDPSSPPVPLTDLGVEEPHGSEDHSNDQTGTEELEAKSLERPEYLGNNGNQIGAEDGAPENLRAAEDSEHHRLQRPVETEVVGDDEDNEMGVKAACQSGNKAAGPEGEGLHPGEGNTPRLGCVLIRVHGTECPPQTRALKSMKEDDEQEENEVEIEESGLRLYPSTNAIAWPNELFQVRTSGSFRHFDAPTR